MIQVEKLSKIYRTEEVQTAALNGISFGVKAGEFLAIMGPSGCGKSTLLNMLGLLDSPTSGSYQLNGNEVTLISSKQKTRIRKENIGFIFQNFNLIDELTVFENVELPLIYNKVSSKERKHRVEKILEELNIAHRIKHYPQQLSGGQQQRVAVARALVGNPKIILADEPTGNLDSKNGSETMELLANLHAKGSTIVMVTHSHHDANYASRILEMKDGNIFSDQQNDRKVEVFTV